MAEVKLTPEEREKARLWFEQVLLSRLRRQTQRMVAIRIPFHADWYPAPHLFDHDEWIGLRIPKEYADG